MNKKWRFAALAIVELLQAETEAENPKSGPLGKFIVCKKRYKPEDILGKKVSILVNLAPRKLRGIESQGMILMAEDADGRLCFVSPTEDVSDGSEVK